VEHAALGSYVDWAKREYPGSRAALHHSVCFDLAVTSVWIPLLSGGCVELTDEQAGAAALAQRLEQGPGYGLLKMTPTHLQVVGELLHGKQLGGGVECLVVGGEALRGEHLEFWKQSFPKALVVNEYGPTETTVGCCVQSMDLAAVDEGRMPIGRPVPRVRLYVLDEAYRAVPVGVAGELYIAGDQVARGYLQRAGQTAERFLPEPFGERLGGRVYRSGDRVRWRFDGSLEYLGRLDEQVKIRGFRVEPGEVESVMSSYPGIREARVVVRQEGGGEPRLVGYVVGEVEPEELRAHVRRSLPEYMVPAAFVALERFPLTANGKLDHRALPAPLYETPADRYVAPRTILEKQIAEIWKEILAVSEIGIHDNFFDLGGNSLLVYRVYSRLRTFRSDLQVVHLFRFTTVEALAEYLSPDARPDTSSLMEGRSRAKLRKASRRLRA
jgi:acyl-coenzyme A synthetase/AMP-(fatty) acid ligase